MKYCPRCQRVYGVSEEVCGRSECRFHPFPGHFDGRKVVTPTFAVGLLDLDNQDTHILRENETGYVRNIKNGELYHDPKSKKA